MHISPHFPPKKYIVTLQIVARPNIAPQLPEFYYRHQYPDI